MSSRGLGGSGRAATGPWSVRPPNRRDTVETPVVGEAILSPDVGPLRVGCEANGKTVGPSKSALAP